MPSTGPATLCSLVSYTQFPKDIMKSKYKTLCLDIKIILKIKFKGIKMKKLLGIMVMLPICAIIMSIAGSKANAETVTVTEYLIGEVGSLLRWNGFQGDDCDCYSNGDDCKIKVTKTTTSESISPVLEGGWILHSGISKLKAEITSEISGDFSEELSVSNYTFLEGTTTRIINCDEFPELNGREVDLSGISTDVNGNFDVYILVSY